MELDEVITGTQPSSNEADGGKRKVICVESEETQDCVPERLADEDFSQKEADEVGFVPSALSEPRGATPWRDNRCSEKRPQVRADCTNGDGRRR